MRPNRNEPLPQAISSTRNVGLSFVASQLRCTPPFNLLSDGKLDEVNVDIGRACVHALGLAHFGFFLNRGLSV